MTVVFVYYYDIRRGGLFSYVLEINKGETNWIVSTLLVLPIRVGHKKASKKIYRRHVEQWKSGTSTKSYRYSVYVNKSIQEIVRESYTIHLKPSQSYVGYSWFNL
jgi:hypothetical protein